MARWLPRLIKLALVLGGIAIMLGLLIVFFWRKPRPAKVAIPWGPREPIYAFILKNLTESTGAFNDKAGDLPDEAQHQKPGNPRWVAGGLDGAFDHHSNSDQSKQKATRIAALVAQIAHTDSSAAQRELYGLLLDGSVLECLDAAVEQMVQQRTPITPALHEFVLALARQSPDREPVKFALALMGIIRDPEDVKAITLLGCHEEFTLYAAAALMNALKEPEPELFALAQRVHGWGRIHIVERLANTKTPKVKRWLLLHGYDNRIMHEYLAFICAVAGDLHVALAAKQADPELLKAATDLLRALITGGPAQDINDYAHAATVAADYLRHVKNQAPQLSFFPVVQSLITYLRDDKWQATAREKNGWTEERRRGVLDSAQAYLSQREWVELAKNGLESNDWNLFNDATFAAKTLGMDTWPAHWKRVQSDPKDSSRWFAVMAQATKERITDIIQLAESRLPLQEIASGPSDSLGLGPEYWAHSALDMILQSLGSFSGKGRSLIIAGLRSPVVRNRNMALKAFASWAATDRDEEILSVLRRASAAEPLAEVKERMERILAGGTAQ